jgi:hypothetical protein
MERGVLQPGDFPGISNLFRVMPKNDPILGLAHQGIAPCPTPNSRRVRHATIEFQKLVESGTVLFEERFLRRSFVTTDSIFS